MIWFDALLEHLVDDQQIRRVIATTAECAYDDVAVVHDILELNDRPITCVVQLLPPEGYPQQISIYVNQNVVNIDSRLPVVEAAASIASQLKLHVMIADDGSPSPYAMLCVDPNGVATNVTIDATELDDFGVYRIIHGARLG